MTKLVCGLLQVAARPYVGVEHAEMLAALKGDAVKLRDQLAALVEEVPNATEPDDATQTLLPSFRGFLFAFNVVNRLGVVAKHVDDRIKNVQVTARAFRLAVLSCPAVIVDEGRKNAVAIKIRTVFQSE